MTEEQDRSSSLLFFHPLRRIKSDASDWFHENPTNSAALIRPVLKLVLLLTMSKYKQVVGSVKYSHAPILVGCHLIRIYMSYALFHVYIQYTYWSLVIRYYPYPPHEPHFPVGLITGIILLEKLSLSLFFWPSRTSVSIGTVLVIAYPLLFALAMNPFQFHEGWFYHFLLPWEWLILSTALELAVIYYLTGQSYYKWRE